VLNSTCFCLRPKIGCNDLWLYLSCNYDRLCSNRWRICTIAETPFCKAKGGIVINNGMWTDERVEKNMLIYAHPFWRWRIKPVRDSLTWPVHVWACCLRSTSWHVVKHNPFANLRLEWGGASEMSWKETPSMSIWMNTKVLCWATNAWAGFGSQPKHFLYNELIEIKVGGIH